MASEKVGVSTLRLAIVSLVLGGLSIFLVGREARASLFGPSPDEFDKWVGAEAPGFTVTDLDGNRITLSKLKGRRVVLDFWATWCPPCRKEIPHFIGLRRMTIEEELMIIGISSESPAKIRSFAAKQGINYPLVSTRDLPSPYSDITAIPTTFFIDQNGVIQDVLVGYHSLEDLRLHALGPDYEGTLKEQPVAPVASLVPSTATLSLVLRWEITIPGAEGMCVGDWNLDGEPDVLVTDKTAELHVIDTSGNEITSHTLPTTMSLIEYGLIESEPVLLGYSIWGTQVTVVDRQGKKLWSYDAPMGVDGAHWGDLDGDGNDEMIIGMNGSGGLHGVDEDGKSLWKVSEIGNVWNQSAISASEGHPATVFASETEGMIRVFDGDGNAIRTVRPLDLYFIPIHAADIDGNGTVQILGIGGKLAKDFNVVAFDAEGSAAWRATVQWDFAAWRVPQFACGDIDGDGIGEWVFAKGFREAVIASPQGEQIASVSLSGWPERIGIVSPGNGKGMLVVLRHEKLSAYSAE